MVWAEVYVPPEAGGTMKTNGGGVSAASAFEGPTAIPDRRKTNSKASLRRIEAPGVARLLDWGLSRRFLNVTRPGLLMELSMKASDLRGTHSCRQPSATAPSG